MTYADFKRLKKNESSADPSAITWIKGDIIGRGAFGTVYKAYDKRKGEIMAIKEFRFTFKNKQKTLREFEQETKIMKKLQHPNIVEFKDYKVDHQQGLIYLLMEYVQWTHSLLFLVIGK